MILVSGKAFKTKYAVNNPKAGSGYEVGDLGVMYVVNRPVIPGSMECNSAER